MSRQLNYMQSRDLGYNYDAAISVRLNPDPSAQRLIQIISTAMDKGKLLKEELQKHPEISDVGMGTHVFGTPGWARLSYTDDEQNFRRFRLLSVDPWYIPAFDIKIKAGT